MYRVALAENILCDIDYCWFFNDPVDAADFMMRLSDNGRYDCFVYMTPVFDKENNA